MIIAFFVLIVVSAILILPGWLWSRRRFSQSTWLLGVPFFSVGLWLLLTLWDFGSPPTLSNIIEAFGVAVFSIIAAYIKFFALDRFPATRSRGTFVVYALMTFVVVAVRAFTPTLPE